METFGERLKKLRRARNIGVAEFADAIQVTPDAVMKIESGKRGRAFERLPKIAKILDCNIDDLFPEMDEKSASADAFTAKDMEGWER